MPPTILVVDDNQELLTLLTQFFEAAGYDVLAANRGRAAIEVCAKAVTAPKVALLDILLPDMMGYHLADALRKQFAGLPLLFITGVFKGGKHASEAKAKYGAAGYFEKPFEAQKLLEAVKAIAPVERPAPSAAPAPQESPFEVELDFDVEEEGPQEAMELTGKIRVTGAGDLTAELRGQDLTASPLQQNQRTSPRSPPPGMPALSPAGKKDDPHARRGELSDNLPKLITAFYLSKETGELGIQRGKVKKVVYFEKGQPVFALSNLLADRFGQFLVRVGKIKPEQLQDATQVAQATKRRTGDVLIERGLLRETERLYYVGQQVKSIIYSLFGWEEGTWMMTFREKVAAESIKLDAHPAQLIVRGIKKLYKIERMRKLISAEDKLIPSLQPAYQLHEIELEKWEAELLPKVDGTRTLAQLLQLSPRPEHQVYGFLCSMLALTVLERR